jgi:hypothetical protein
MDMAGTPEKDEAADAENERARLTGEAARLHRGIRVLRLARILVFALIFPGQFLALENEGSVQLVFGLILFVVFAAVGTLTLFIEDLRERADETQRILENSTRKVSVENREFVEAQIRRLVRGGRERRRAARLRYVCWGLILLVVSIPLLALAVTNPWEGSPPDRSSAGVVETPDGAAGETAAPAGPATTPSQDADAGNEEDFDFDVDGPGTSSLWIASFAFYVYLIPLGFWLHALTARVAEADVDILNATISVEIVQSATSQTEAKALRFYRANQEELNRYYRININHTKLIFWVGVGSILVGILFAGAVIVAVARGWIGAGNSAEGGGDWVAQGAAAVLGVAATLMTGFVGNVLLQMYQGSTTTLKAFHRTLAETNSILFAHVLASNLDSKDRQQAIKGMIAALSRSGPPALPAEDAEPEAAG